MNEGDITKLPKWAQRRIQNLERDLAHERERLATGPEDSNTFADVYSQVERPLGDSPTVAFRLPNNRHMRREFTVRLDEENEQLVVMGGESIAIYPRSSNSIRIKLERL